MAENVLGQLQDNILHSDNYTWISVGGYSIRIAHEKDGGARIGVYKIDKEDCDTIRSIDLPPAKLFG